MSRFSIFHHALLAMAAITLTATAASGRDVLEAIAQDEPSFFVRVDVDRADRTYRAGESMKVNVISEQDAYLYVLYKQADGKVFQIFPNSVQKENKVKAKESVQIPASDDQFRWRIGPPFGTETIKVLASIEPLKELDDPKFREKMFNPVSNDEVREVAEGVQNKKPGQWVDDMVTIVTRERGEKEPVAEGRRFGVFFGVSETLYNEETKIVSEGKWSASLPCPANNATVTARLMRSMGKLDDAKVFVNEEATKANLEKAITEWLPSVSRPGDTVFVMFCGHGGQTADDNGDEKDGKDEWLLVYDYCDISIFSVLLKQHQEGKLPPSKAARFNELLEVARKAGSNEAIDSALIRHTGVTDDLFGHWLQRLSNRKILVMLDTCHAGGFATHEKGLSDGKSSAGPQGFDFLDGEVARLKDLGQPDSALLGACGAQEVSYGLRPPEYVVNRWLAETKSVQAGDSFDERVLENLAVFTYHLTEAMVMLPSPADLEQVHARARDTMREYFVKRNEVMKRNGKEPLTPHEATLFNNCTVPILMKP